MESRVRIKVKLGFDRHESTGGKTHIDDVVTSKGNQATQYANGFRGGLGAYSRQQR